MGSFARTSKVACPDKVIRSVMEAQVLAVLGNFEPMADDAIGHTLSWMLDDLPIILEGLVFAELIRREVVDGTSVYRLDEQGSKLRAEIIEAMPQLGQYPFRVWG